MAWTSSTILLIDPDETAARELADLLENRAHPPKVMMASDVRRAEPMLRTVVFDWMFIRIIVWDDYQRLRPLLPMSPRRVVFLSGRMEKCTAHLLRIWNKWMEPHFVPRPLDIFFVKSRARFEPVRYGDLRQVDVENGKL